MAQRPVITVQGIVRHPDGQRLLVCEAPRAGFQRLFGGKIEFGEMSHEALAREFREELGLEVVVGRLLGVLQNRFVYDGSPGHEVVLVHDVQLSRESDSEHETFERVDRIDAVGTWRSLVDPPDVPLYAEGWEALLADSE